MKNSKTLVKFYIDKFNEDLLAFFPQLNYNKQIYGNDVKVSYEYIGQHSPCSKEYVNIKSPYECAVREATKEEYTPLLNELTEIGYNLKVLNKK